MWPRMLRAWGLPECIVAFVAELRKAMLMMTKQNHKNKQSACPGKHWVCHAPLFWFLVSCFLDPCLMWQIGWWPTAGQRGNFDQCSLCGLWRTTLARSDTTLEEKKGCFFGLQLDTNCVSFDNLKKAPQNSHNYRSVFIFADKQRAGQVWKLCWLFNSCIV